MKAALGLKQTLFEKEETINNLLSLIQQQSDQVFGKNDHINLDQELFMKHRHLKNSN